MGTGNKTLEQLARDLNVHTRDVAQAARDIFKLPVGDSRDPQFKFSPSQCRKIQAELGKSEPAKDISPGDTRDANLLRQETDSQPGPALPMRPDSLSDLSGFEFEDLKHGIWFHTDVAESLAGHDHLHKRLGIVLQHLGAHGRTTIVKGCRDEVNRGWRRSPLGGGNGMQYYLWWTVQGSRVAKDLDLSAGEILIRAVRHHDDHAPLSAGELQNYLPIQQRDLQDSKLIDLQPWTKDQLDFIEADDPVRLIIGRPGAGKTTALWKAIEARCNQRVLYLTWSRELTQFAKEHLYAFAPKDVKVEARDFTTFLSEICDIDTKRQPLAESQAAFTYALRFLGQGIRGPWAGREHALYAEVRAALFGSAIPGEADSQICSGVFRLKDAAYLDRRDGTHGVGKKAAEALLEVIHSIEPAQPFDGIFPELAAATKAIEILRRDGFPDGFADFDRIVVDEVQDLTLVEVSVILELCRAIARVRGYAPWLLIAGDDGQTVRPSGFDWGMLNELIARSVGIPKRFQLEENLRCPTRIANVIMRASTHYSRLGKSRRPTKQRQWVGRQHVDANLFHVDVPSTSAAIALLEQLEDIEGVVIISPRSNLPEWIPEHLRDMILSPAEVKGLEYQSVCVFEPGKLLAQLDTEIAEKNAAQIEEHARRTSIDHLRVALSRATETLAFIDVEANPAEQALSWDMLGDAAPFDAEDLVEHFKNADVTTEERVLVRTNDARAMIEIRPKRAWRLAHQAVRLLGDCNLPNGVVDETVRLEAYKTLLACAARLLVDGVPQGVQRCDIVTAAGETLKAMKADPEENAFNQLDAWTTNRMNPPFALLDAALGLGPHAAWLSTALTPVFQELRHNIGECAASTAAKSFTGDVEEWLKQTGFVGEGVSTEARRLRCLAVDTLIQANDLRSAVDVLEKIEPKDLFLTGRLREAQGRPVEAAEAFIRANAPLDALRNWRMAGKWERALRLAEGSEKTDLDWLNEVKRLMDRRPSGQSARLTKSERDRLIELLESVEKRPIRKKE